MEPVKKKSRFHIAMKYIFFSVVGITLASGLIGAFTKEHPKETTTTIEQTTTTETTKKAEDPKVTSVKEIFAKNPFLGNYQYMEQVTEKLYRITSDNQNYPIYTAIFENNKITAFRIYVPDVVEFPLDFAEDYSIDEAKYNKAIKIKIPKLIKENPKKKSESTSETKSSIKYPLTSAMTEEFKKQFSTWDGSHRTLVKTIKKDFDGLKFEHINTVADYDQSTGHMIVRMKFKLGGQDTVYHTIAEIDLSGNVLDYKTEI